MEPDFEDGLDDLSETDRKYFEDLGLYGIGIIQKLTEEGMVVAQGYEMTPKGIAAWDQLEASGFKPKDGDLLMFWSGMFSDRDALALYGMWRRLQDMDKQQPEPQRGTDD